MKTLHSTTACLILLAFALFAFGCAPSNTTSGCDTDQLTDSMDFADFDFVFDGACSNATSSVEEPPSAEPKIDIELAVNGADADSSDSALSIKENQQLSWTYKVTNTGNVELTDIQVTDDRLGAVDCPKSYLPVGESMTCAADGSAEAGQFAHEGCVQGDYAIYDDTGVNVTTKEDCDKSHYVGVVNTQKPQKLASLKTPPATRFHPE
jgi:hypothetical protein